MESTMEGSKASLQDLVTGRLLRALEEGSRVGAILSFILPILGVVMLLTDFVVPIDEIYILSFHLIFTLLAAGAFFWSVKGTIVRSTFWIGFVTVVLLITFLRGQIEAAELTEIPALTTLLVFVATTAWLWRGALVQLKQEQEHLKELNSELEQRASELYRANRDLKERNEENEMFVYSVSHDLRSPLVNLQGFSRELQMVSQDLRDLLGNADVPPNVRERGLELMDEDMADSLRFIRTGVMRLSGIIDALLRFSRAGRVEYQWQQVEVGTVVERVVDGLRGTIEERGAIVDVGDMPSAWGDPAVVEQIFANLIGNALEYLHPGRPGLVEVGGVGAAEPDENGERPGFNTYYVKDNGRGIPEGYEPKVFRIFQRLHPDTEGEGLGLTLVRRMVERHGGRVRVESTEGAGSTFFVELPEGQEEGTPYVSVVSDEPSPED